MIRQSSPGDPQPCDNISKEIVDGKRQLVIGENVEARGFLLQVLEIVALLKKVLLYFILYNVTCHYLT